MPSCVGLDSFEDDRESAESRWWWRRRLLLLLLLRRRAIEQRRLSLGELDLDLSCHCSGWRPWAVWIWAEEAADLERGAIGERGEVEQDGRTRLGGRASIARRTGGAVHPDWQPRAPRRPLASTVASQKMTKPVLCTESRFDSESESGL